MFSPNVWQSAIFSLPILQGDKDGRPAFAIFWNQFPEVPGTRRMLLAWFGFPVQISQLQMNGVSKSANPSYSSAPGLPVRGACAGSHQQAAAEPHSYRCPTWRMAASLHPVFPAEAMSSLLASLCLGFPTAKCAQQTYLINLFRGSCYYIHCA